jgi:hypothetical protein
MSGHGSVADFHACSARDRTPTMKLLPDTPIKSPTPPAGSHFGLCKIPTFTIPAGHTNTSPHSRLTNQFTDQVYESALMPRNIICRPQKMNNLSSFTGVRPAAREASLDKVASPSRHLDLRHNRYGIQAPLKLTDPSGEALGSWRNRQLHLRRAGKTIIFPNSGLPHTELLHRSRTTSSRNGGVNSNLVC